MLMNLGDPCTRGAARRGPGPGPTDGAGAGVDRRSGTATAAARQPGTAALV
ncbi:MAG TPA: hypothetical protein VFC16_11445 [Nakamurella sp.]|nr:hypothetical protein [Nakamurella sp.]